MSPALPDDRSTAPAGRERQQRNDQMSLSINRPSQADAGLSSVQNADARLSAAVQKLSSGRRITHAAVDPAGAAVANRLQAALRSYESVTRGIQDGVSLIQTAEGGLSSMQDMAGRIKELAVQAGNGTLSPEDRSAIQTEVDSLTAEIDRVARDTEFNQRKLLDGGSGAGNGITVPTSLDGTGSVVEIEDSQAAALGLAGLDVSSPAGAQAAMTAADSATQAISTRRASLGAFENAFTSSISRVQVAAENTAAAESRIADADIAREVVAATAARIQRDFAIAVQTQSTQNAGSVLRLVQ